MEQARLLLGQGAKPDSKEKELGQTGLHIAAANGNVEMIELLLSFNSDINKRDWNFNIPVQYAVQGDHLEAVKVFFDRSNKSPFEQRSFGEVSLSIHYY